MIYTYDGSFYGLFTAIFEAYATKTDPSQIVKKQALVPSIFDPSKDVETDSNKAERVLKGLRKRVSPQALRGIYKSFHSELADIELVIYNYVKLALQHTITIEKDFRQAPVLRVSQVEKMVNREIHRMHAFVRFQQMSDGLYAATIKPDFDVIPFIGPHFRKRYADQQWLIYDVSRDYGLYYDLSSLTTVEIEDARWAGNGKISKSFLSDDESQFQQLWRQYFSTTGIDERNNPKLHLRHVPRRYWQFLPEKYLTD
ncbi:MAG: TIGR03915 family putative DNA repair protein [Bacteroidota bacterium]